MGVHNNLRTDYFVIIIRHNSNTTYQKVRVNYYSFKITAKWSAVQKGVLQTVLSFLFFLLVLASAFIQTWNTISSVKSVVKQLGLLQQ